MQFPSKSSLLLLTLGLTACAATATAPAMTGTAPAVATVTPTEGAMPVTPVPTFTPPSAPTATLTATATPDATRAVEATLEAIRLALVATGVPEGSADFDLQFAARRCAVAPPATPTAGPFALEPDGASAVSADCLGQDLPGVEARAWLDGRWVEAGRFRFAEAADLRAAQQAYEEYFNFLSFQAAPPGDEAAARLAAFVDPADELGSAQSCLAGDITSALGALQARGLYVRLTAPAGLIWDVDYRLSVEPAPYRLAQGWQVRGLRQELVEAATGQVLRTATRPALAGTAWLSYEAGAWRVLDDAGGYYCAPLADFLRTSGVDGN